LENDSISHLPHKKQITSSGLIERPQDQTPKELLNASLSSDKYKSKNCLAMIESDKVTSQLIKT
jgi:hypothetical protein